MREHHQPRTCNRNRPRPAKVVFSLAQAADLRKHLAPTGLPPHHQAAPPRESRPSPTKALPHRHATGRPRLRRPNRGLLRAKLARPNKAIPYRNPGLVQRSHRRPRASPTLAASARPTSPRFSMCLALHFACRSTCFALAHSGHAHRTADQPSFQSPSHHGPGFRKNGRAFPFCAPGPNDCVSGTALPSNHHGRRRFFARPTTTASPRRSRVRCTRGWPEFSIRNKTDNGLLASQATLPVRPREPLTAHQVCTTLWRKILH